MEFLKEAKFMDQCTHEVRMQYWKNIISQCQARPAGQTAKQWMHYSQESRHDLKNYQRTVSWFCLQ